MNLGMRRFDSLAGLLAGTATVAAIVISQASVVMAKSPDEIYKDAMQMTVLIRKSFSDNSWSGGTGVIVGGNGNTYLVLTNDHVACGKSGSYTIRTYDDKSYAGALVQCFGNQGIDLALVSFNSPNQKYRVATLGNSKQVHITDHIYIYGYPGYLDDNGGAKQEPQFSPGYVTSFPNDPNGYALSYNATTWHGMSGAPVFNDDGLVIGIHGEGRVARSDAVVKVHNASDNKDYDLSGYAYVNTGFNLGIPINTFIALAPKAGINSTVLTVVNTPATGNPSRLKNPQSAEDFYTRGLARIDKGDGQGAIKDFDRALARDPNSVKAYFNRAYARGELGDKKGAIADYTQAIQLDPKNAYAYHDRGVVYAELGDWKGAIADCTQAIQLNPKFAEAYVNRGLFRNESGDRKGAIEDYAKAIQLNPKLFQAYYNRAYARYLSRDKQGAIADYTQAIQLDSKNSDTYVNRGNIRADLGDNQGAISDYSQAIQLDSKDSTAYYNRGNSYAALGNMQGAIVDFTQAIQLDPKYSAAYNNRGHARALLGDSPGAIADSTKAIQLNPKNAEAYITRGAVRADLGDKKEAIADLTEAANLFQQQQDMDKYNITIAAIKKLQSK